MQFPLHFEGNLETEKKAGYLPPHWLVKMGTVRVDLDTDSNNNGSIEPEEDDYEDEDALSGRVVCTDRFGDGPGLEHVAEIKLAVEGTSEGTVTLRELGSPKRLRAWADAGRTQEIDLTSVSWAPDEVPSQLWIDGIDEGEGRLRLSLERSGKEPVNDEVRIYVAETISYSPRGNTLYVYEPYLTPTGSLRIWQLIQNHGWQNVRQYCGMEYCTLARLREPGNGDLEIGIVAYHSYGWHNNQHSGTVEVARGTQAQMQAWKGNEPNMYVVESEVPGAHAVKARAAWFTANWKGTLDANRAIVVMMGCNTYDEITAGVGGRSAFGYLGNTFAASHGPNMNLLFGRLNGSLGNGDLRTTGDAYLAGGFVNDFRLYLTPVGPQYPPANPTNVQAGWTTLNPAPQKTFPSWDFEDEGAGCIVFDSYMDARESRDPDQAVTVVQGGGVSARRWFTNADDPGDGTKYAYGVSFDFDPHSPGSIRTRAVSGQSLNWEDDPNAPQRGLSGNPQTYPSDREWDF